MLGWFELLIGRIPLAKTIYGSARQLLDLLQTKPDGTQRVVLIDFPHHEDEIGRFRHPHPARRRHRP